MGKYLDDSVLDAGANLVKNTATRLVLCSGQPANYSEAQNNSPSGKRLGEIVVDSSDFTVQNGSSQGRRVTMSQQVGVPVNVSGTADHVALVDTTNSVLLYVTTITSTAVTSGNTAQVNAVDLTFNDVT